MKKEEFKLKLGSSMASMPIREKIEFIHNATKKATEKRKEQGFSMTVKKRQMYEMGFNDAIEYLLSDESFIIKHFELDAPKVYLIFHRDPRYDSPTFVKAVSSKEKALEEVGKDVECFFKEEAIE